MAKRTKEDKLLPLAQRAWQQFVASQGAPCLVTPSIPRLFLGDLPAYRRSPIRIISASLNPLPAEFPSDNPFRRFPAAEGLEPDQWADPRYVAALIGYFQQQPVEHWYASLQPLLAGLNASFYPDAPNAALHTFIASPLATDPPWGSLLVPDRHRLQGPGRELWRRLVETFEPHVILLSVARRYLASLPLRRLGPPTTILTVPRQDPIEVTVEPVGVKAQTALLIYCRPANSPFGLLSYADKHRVGDAVLAELQFAVQR